MANIKSQIKRNVTNEKARAQNSAKKSELRTAMKRVETLATEGKKEEAVLALRKAASLLDKAAQSGVISANSAARKKSHLQRVVSEVK